jgi:hypothetical protein
LKGSLKVSGNQDGVVMELKMSRNSVYNTIYTAAMEALLNGRE